MKRTSSLALLAAVALAPAAAQAETLVGLRTSDLHLISFDSATPGTLTGDLALTGFPTGAVPAALDFRPETQALIILARGPVSGSCQLYGVNVSSGAVTAQGASFACPADFSDIDFNPVSDRLRVLSTSENFKVDPANGSKEPNADADFALGDPNVGETPMLGGSAYDRNTSSATATTLFAIEAGNNVLVRVGSVNGSPDSPDTGELTTIDDLSLGLAALDVEADTAFDISGASPNTAYLFSFTPAQAGVNGNLYTVNLTTAATNHVAAVGAGGVDLSGLTVAPGVTLGDGDDDDDDEIIFGGAVPAGLLIVLAGLGLGRRRLAA